MLTYSDYVTLRHFEEEVLVTIEYCTDTFILDLNYWSTRNNMGRLHVTGVSFEGLSSQLSKNNPMCCIECELSMVTVKCINCSKSISKEKLKEMREAMPSYLIN